MPNITLYLENETYIGWLKLDEERKKECKDFYVEDIKKQVEKNENTTDPI